MSAVLGSQGQAAVVWRNPFPEPASISVTLRTDEPAGVFELLRIAAGGQGLGQCNSGFGAVRDGHPISGGPSAASLGSASGGLVVGRGGSRGSAGAAAGASATCQEATVQPYGTLHVPLLYTPAALKLSRCEVLVAVEGSSYSLNTLEWRFPVSAQAEASMAGIVFRCGIPYMLSFALDDSYRSMHASSVTSIPYIATVWNYGFSQLEQGAAETPAPLPLCHLLPHPYPTTLCPSPAPASPPRLLPYRLPSTGTGARPAPASTRRWS